MELVLCIGTNRRRKIKPTQLFDVAHLLRDRGYFPEKQFGEREKIVLPSIEGTAPADGTGQTIAIAKARGLNPCLELQANDVTRATACAIAVTVEPAVIFFQGRRPPGLA